MTYHVTSATCYFTNVLSFVMLVVTTRLSIGNTRMFAGYGGVAFLRQSISGSQSIAKIYCSLIEISESLKLQQSIPRSTNNTHRGREKDHQ